MYLPVLQAYRPGYRQDRVCAFATSSVQAQVVARPRWYACKLGVNTLQRKLALGGVISTASLIPFGKVFALTGLENGVAGLQAYMFTILTCIYLSNAFP